MATIHETAKAMGREARKVNRAMEKLVQAAPAFRSVKDRLITVTGHP